MYAAKAMTPENEAKFDALAYQVEQVISNNCKSEKMSGVTEDAKVVTQCPTLAGSYGQDAIANVKSGNGKTGSWKRLYTFVSSC